MTEVSILLGGPAGKGTASIEKYLVQNLAKSGYYLFSTKNYMSRIRGGHNYHLLRIADQPVFALKSEKYNLIIALDELSEKWHKPELIKNGLLLNIKYFQNVFKNIPLKKPGEINNLIAGYILGLLATEPKELLMQQGCVLAKENNLFGKFKIKNRVVKNNYIFNGNQALGLGAIAGGCKFMAGYPMTPATGIMEYFSDRAEKYNLHFEQAEDEIAAINMAIGSSYAGLRSLVATSGGGFALMQEGVSLSGMTETPLVIILAQRPAPATGLPTRTEQGDLNFCLYSGHGEFNRIIFAPGSLNECLETAARAFALADQYQIPVFILTDQYLADSVQPFEKKLNIITSQRSYNFSSKEYKRFKLTKNNISPLAFPGISAALVKADSDEHDEEGLITEDLNLRKRMVEKRMGKVPGRFFVRPSVFGTPDAKNIVYCWGSNKMILKETVALLQKEKIKIKGLHFSQLFPLDKKYLKKIFMYSQKVIGIENNYTSQFSQLLKLNNIETNSLIKKYDGKPFTVMEMAAAIKKELRK